MSPAPEAPLHRSARIALALAEALAPPRLYAWAALALALGGALFALGAGLIASAIGGPLLGAGVGLTMLGALLLLGARQALPRPPRGQV